jgi:hypothetical protein
MESAEVDVRKEAELLEKANRCRELELMYFQQSKVMH